MGKYKRKTERKLVFNQQNLQEARRRIEKGESKRQVAESMGVNECTLRKRLKSEIIPTSLGRFKPVFTPEMENELAKHCKALHDIFFGLELKTLQSAAFHFAEINKVEHRFNKDKKLAGKDWIAAFCKRQSLSLQSSEKCSLERGVDCNQSQVELFFNNLKSMCQEAKFPPHRIYNMDESDLTTVPNKVAEVLAPKGKKSVGKVASAQRDQLVTVICCMNATGAYVPPTMIFPRKQMEPELIDCGPVGSIRMLSDNGFINNKLFLEWLHHFSSYVKTSKDNPVLLILDNHVSHCSLEVILLCRERGISLLSLPSHASHKIQPLDRTFFGPLKAAYSSECDKWMVNHPGCTITQSQVAELFAAAYCHAATLENATNGFRCTGICPYNPDISLDEDFAPPLIADNIHKPETNLSRTSSEAAEVHYVLLKQEPV